MSKKARLGKSKVKVRNVLAVGAHPDDIELGCAGALLQHKKVGDRVFMAVLTCGELGAKSVEGRSQEAQMAADVIGATLIHGPFEDGFVPLTSETVNFIEQIIKKENIDTVYVHSPQDAHQDHLLASRATIAAARKINRVLFYQSPSTVEFNPTMFVDIKKHLKGKIAALACHHSQVEGSETLDLSVVKTTAHYWGSRGRLDYAEAFEPYRFSWNIMTRISQESKDKKKKTKRESFEELYEENHAQLGFSFDLPD